ncbi:hypothetical protein OEZ85_009774 [Tetradesmus obliquus]|uniref:ShKT domain-containing protein n=1 Tax=Tetradesmus obliquus TaxID=3088 RepID=A0ABY8UA18_TETOB|nr:hypothetical protein OEZ85_009774 [Tetradesmus obliquus]
MTFMADSLARKIPFVIGAIVVLLVVNTALQYAAGPALQQALPPQEMRNTVRVGTVQEVPSNQHGPNHDLITDVAPGGADAELLCADKKAGCDPQLCSKVSVKYQECKATCNTCDELRSTIQADTKLQVRVVQQLSACIDLLPSCAAWVKESRCTREPKSMLELCQASCGFCLPPLVSPLAADSSSSSSKGGSSSQQHAAGTLRDSSSRGGSDGATSSTLLDDCQDDINVCPYLAFTGLCGSDSLWIATQCPRSCKKCSPSVMTAGSHRAAEQPQLTQQIVDSSISKDSDSTTADAPTSKSAGSVLKQLVLATPKESRYSLYGSHAADGTVFTAQQLQEWPVQGCKDYVDRCPAWAADGECSRNVDYMAISCKASCKNCKLYSTQQPFRLVQLNSGYAMPAVGFGTAGLGIGTAAAVQYAVSAGYRLIDTAESPDWYSEDQVGVGIAAAKVPREQLFLTSKVHPRDLGRNATLAALRRSLAKLQTHYLDLFLLHYPSCSPGTNCVPHPHKRWQDSWKALEELQAAQLVRSIGVSNFGLAEMAELLKLAKVKPAVLESRSDPFAINHHLINLAIENNITFVGYSSLGTQWINSPAATNPVFSNEVLQEVAANHPGKSVAQVVLRWALQRGQVVIPRSSSTQHIADNLALFDFELSDVEMQAINGLDGTWKTGGLPLPVA